MVSDIIFCEKHIPKSVSVHLLFAVSKLVDINIVLETTKDKILKKEKEK